MSDAWLIAGLGNPGAEYQGTRHNIGFAAIESLARRLSVNAKRHKRANALVAEAHVGTTPIVLVQPLDFMNLSGGSIKALMAFYRIPLERLIVAHDDLDLAFDVLRVKCGGGDAGHNGLRSIRSALGSGEYVRIRLGIGRPPGRQDPAVFVLKPFTKDERSALPGFLDRADDAMIAVIDNGVPWAQNRFNSQEQA